MKFVKLKTIKKVNSEKVYHLTVKNNHNFFANKLCVHNCDFTGEVGIILINHGQQAFKVQEGDRIAQGVLATVCDHVKFKVVDTITKQTERSGGGYGSTGLKVKQI